MNTAKKNTSSKKRGKTRTAAAALKPWAGRFTEATNKLVEEFTASIPYDWRLYPYDIAGSIAHATMLAKTGIITKKEAARIVRGLEDILKDITTGVFKFRLELCNRCVERGFCLRVGNYFRALHYGVPAAAKAAA